MIECRADDERSRRLVQALNDLPAWQCCTTERVFAQRLQGSCQSPIAGFAELHGSQITLRGVIGAPDGTEIYRGTHSGPVTAAAAIGIALAERLLDAGARPLFERLRDAS